MNAAPVQPLAFHSKLETLNSKLYLMISLKRIIIGVVWLVAIFLIGSFGYVFLEGWSFFEGFYMTVITLTTVGYGEVRPLTQTGRTFTIMLIFLGVGFMFYVVSAIAQVVVEGQLRDVFGRRRLEREIRKYKRSLYYLRFRPYRGGYCPGTQP